MSGTKKNGAFEAKVLTHLEYIKDKQDEHDLKFETILKTFEDKRANCYKKFEEIEKNINTAKGIAVGAMTVGGAGLLGSILEWFRIR